MDQIREENDPSEIKELLRELLKMQEQLLHRLERLETAVDKLGR